MQLQTAQCGERRRSWVAPFCDGRIFIQFVSTALAAHRGIPLILHVILLLVVDNAIWATGVLSCARVQSAMKGGVFLEAAWSLLDGLL